MNIKRPLAPRFLNRLDNYLLLNKPEIWSARTHLVIYYGVLFMITLAVIAYMVPDDPRTRSSAPLWIGFVAVISVIVLTIWLIYLLRFNVFKRYGSIKPIQRLTTFLLYFISVGTIVLFAFVKPYVETFRANKAYTSEEIVNDINAINIKICQLEYDSLDHDWDIDTLRVVDKKPVTNYSNHYDAEDYEETVVAIDSSAVAVTTDTVTLLPHRPLRTIDTSELASMIIAKDSLTKINDTLYVSYESPDYVFLSPYNVYEFSDYGFNLPYNAHKFKKPILNSSEIYKKVIVNYQPPDKATVKKELNTLLTKYTDNLSNPYPDYYTEENNRSYANKIKKKYHLNPVSRSMENITDRKFGWITEDLPIIFRFFYYITLCITLLVFIFRHSTTRTFFLSLLTAFVLSIITSLCISFFNRYSGDIFFSWIFFYFTLFLILASLVWANKTRSVITGIAINLFVSMVAFIPLTAVSYYYSRLSARERRSMYSPEVDNTINMQQHLLYAEIAGSLILLVLIATYVQALYRRWYALPEQ